MTITIVENGVVKEVDEAEFAASVPASPPPPVPVEVTKLWLMRTLRAIQATSDPPASYEDVLLAGLPGMAGEVQRDFDAAKELARTDALIIGVASAWGWTSGNIDDAFRIADKAMRAQTMEAVAADLVAAAFPALS